jgi:hypothetical protein
MFLLNEMCQSVWKNVASNIKQTRKVSILIENNPHRLLLI